MYFYVVEQKHKSEIGIGISNLLNKGYYTTNFLLMELSFENINFKEPLNAEKAFEKSIEGFFKVFNVSPGGMCLTEDSILIEINTIFTSIFGYTREEAIGQSNFSLGTIEVSELQRIRKIIAASGKLVNEEMMGRHKDGHIVYSLVTTMPVELGGRHLILSSFNNITQIKQQSSIIAEQHKDILDSINYAKRIQEALFPPKAFVESILPQSFVLLKPKAVVTGDFYWMEKIGDKIFVAAADCTGHGVPGALMSIIGFNLISKSVNTNGTTRPCDILNELSRGIYKTLRQNSRNEGVQDGMEISVISIDIKKGTLEFAAARQPVYRVRENELLKLSPDRFPIGIYSGQYLQEFNNQQIQIESGDTIYMFTDGYSDQFGGPEKKKFKTLQFQKLLLSIQHFPMEEQKLILNKKIEDWKGDFEQVDDIMIIGIRIP